MTRLQNTVKGQLGFMMDDNISLDTNRLFGSGIHESIIGSRGSSTDLRFISFSTCRSVPEIRCLDADDPVNRVHFQAPGPIAIPRLDERVGDGCSMHINVQPEERQRNRRVPSRNRPVSRPYGTTGGTNRGNTTHAHQQSGQENMSPEQQQSSSIIDLIKTMDQEAETPLLPGECPNCLENERSRAEMGPTADGNVRDIFAECVMCHIPDRLAAKRCFCCSGFLCYECLPSHEHFYPLHITIAPVFTFTPGYLLNAVTRRFGCGLRRLRSTCLYVCCCNAQNLNI